VSSLSPFAGLDGWAVWFYTFSLIIVLAMLAWTGALFVISRRARRSQPSSAEPDDFLWVFLVPALDEEVTIADSVQRLLAAECAHRLVLVIDDGSTDRTGEILSTITDPDLVVLSRRPPEAQLGKAAALNAAWRMLDAGLREGRWGDWPRDRIVVVVVDADGRLGSQSPALVASHFADPRVGGVQLRVRIYNRDHVLTWFQDVEFGTFGLLYQLGRSHLGTAGMGGNGQFNRLSALDDVVADPAEGPWRDTLTEDQDLGLRLIVAGWHGRQEIQAPVEQQGVFNLRRLLRQRTRWAQGNLQALTHLRALARCDRSLLVRADLIGWLLMPFFQFVVAITFVMTVIFVGFGLGGFGSASGLVGVVTFYLLGIGGVLFGCLAWGAERGRWGMVLGWLVAHVYVLYSFLIWPVLARAAVRQLFGRGGWAKTSREAISGDSGAAA
jgi:cellulose synthase/poly-beta-1,6-N-acetylglucosamine synthase-like glycosyltransferase